jgi:hypothetical protein
MATTEELDLVIKTVGDTTGAQQVTQSLQKTQQAAAGLQQQLTSGQQGANTVMRALMAQHAQTQQEFEKARQTVTQSTGVSPTLTARDFGIQAQQVTTAARTAAAATTQVGEATRVTGNEVARLGFAFLGAGIGLSAFTAAGRLAHETVADIVTQAVSLDQATRDNSLALGQQAAGYQAWAAQVSQAAGVTEQSLLQAGTAAAQLGRQAGFGPEQTQSLVALAAALAQIRGADVGTVMNELTAAMGGNQQAAQSLGLQLDAASLSYTNFGDATGQVFNLLDPSTQATLRYDAALGQLHNQVQTATGPVQDLHRAQGDLNANMDQFAKLYGPGLTAALAGIEGAAAKALAGILALNNIQLQRYKDAGSGDEDFKNERALAQGAVDALSSGTEVLRGAVGQRFSEAGTLAKQANDALRDTTGFDVQATAANVASQAIDGVGAAIDAVKDKAGQAASAITQPFRAADADFRAAASSAQDARDAQLRALAAQVADPLAALAAGRSNEATAAQALVEYQRQKVDLTADEANIRLQMLPTQQRMLELQNETNRAQIEATQRSLPATRNLQDLQNRLEIDRLIATSNSRSLAERQAAQREAAGLFRQLPDAGYAAAVAQQAGLPAQRAAQDVGLQSQLQGLDLQQALFPDQFRVDMLTQLGTIAEAAKQSAQREVAFDIQAIANLTLNITGPLTADDENRIVQLTSDEFAKQLHSAVQQADKAPTPSSRQLLAGG